jgi:DNA-binding NarL/FixJ family response regulator
LCNYQPADHNDFNASIGRSGMYRILIAEKHAIVREALKRIIEDVDSYQIIGDTGDGLEILPLIRQLRPNMIILGISLPNLRGIEAIPKIRRFNRKTKILILTMHKIEEYVYECLVSGAHGYMLKEDTVAELLLAIESIRKEQIYISRSFSSNVIKMLAQRKGDTEYRTPFALLTERQREILRLIADGNSNKRIAGKLGNSVRTIEHHRFRIMKKLSIANTAGLIRYAIENKFVD